MISAALICFGLYLTFVPDESPSPWFTPARKILGALGGSRAVTAFWAILGSAHVLESIYTFTLCRKHTGFVVGVSLLVYPPYH
jgi:hypothetical protein